MKINTVFLSLAFTSGVLGVYPTDEEMPNIPPGVLGISPTDEEMPNLPPGVLGISSTYEEMLNKPPDEEAICGTMGLTGLETEHSRTIDSSHELWGSAGAGLVPYQFQVSCDPADIPLFKEAMAYVESISCIRFVPRTNQETYLEFARACYRNGTVVNSCGDCWCFSGSYVTTLRGSGAGKRVRLVTGTTLEAGNYRNRGHITHELLHVLGHAHTQKRPDRDDYITIDLSKNSNNYQYTKCSDCDSMGTDYDCMSVMHYRDSGFANTTYPNGTYYPTMEAIDPLTCDLKSTNRFLRWSDIDLINANYQCIDPLPQVSRQGVLKSHEEYPNLYLSAIGWIKYLVVTPGNTIEFTFVDGFDIFKYGTGCRYDYVKIVDGSGQDLIPKSCGLFNVSFSLTSTTNRASIEYVSIDKNWYVQLARKGFKLQWREIGVTTEQTTSTTTKIRPKTKTATTTTTKEQDCWTLGTHRTIQGVGSLQRCYRLCQEDDDCEYFRFINPSYESKGTSHLKEVRYKNKIRFFSGKRKCSLTCYH